MSKLVEPPLPVKVRSVEVLGKNAPAYVEKKADAPAAEGDKAAAPAPAEAPAAK